MARRSNRSRSRSRSTSPAGASQVAPAAAPPARSPDDPAALLADLADLRRRLADVERSRLALLSERTDLVRAARALGVTWPVLTAALGVSRQALLRPRP